MRTSPPENTARGVRAARANLSSRIVLVLGVCLLCAIFILLSSAYSAPQEDSDIDDISSLHERLTGYASGMAPDILALADLGSNFPDVAALPPVAASNLAPIFSATLAADRWDKAPGGDATVCVVVRTYVGHRAALPALLASLISQGHPALTIFLADTGSGASFGAGLSTIATTFNALAGRRAVVVSSRTRASSRAAFPNLAVEDFGYLVTDAVVGDSE